MSTSIEVVGFGSLAQVAQVVEGFERCTLSREEWDHRAHLAVAMWYLTHHDEAKATELMIAGIRRFNHAKQIRRSLRGGYHETLTLFWLGVGQRIVARAPRRPALELVNHFLQFPRNLHERCYSAATLWSCEARCTWVEPDLLSIDSMLAAIGRRADFRDVDSRVRDT